MYQQVLGVPGFPIDTWPTSPLLRSQDYKAMVVDLLKHQLKHLRGLDIPVELDGRSGGCVPQEGDNIDMARAMDIARSRLIARHVFAMHAATSLLEGSDKGPFVIFNADLCTRNMLVNRQTAEIMAVIDVEYTNAMPAPLAHDPPLCLLPRAPEKTLDRDLFPWWLGNYQPAVERFLIAMEGVEARRRRQQQQQQQD